MRGSILVTLNLLVFGALVYTSTASFSTGNFANGVTCGNCHGTKSPNTVVTFQSPPDPFVYGATYNLVVTVANASLSQAGFNVLCTNGKFLPTADTKINLDSTQVTHVIPKPLVNGICSFTVAWRSSFTSGGIFQTVGNAVNGDGMATNIDAWSSTASGFIGNGWVLKLPEEHAPKTSVFPNPCGTYIILSGATQNVQISVANYLGKKIYTPYVQKDDRCTIDTSPLAPGIYVLQTIDADGFMQYHSFIKK
jgi:hypothetical protein